MKEYILRSRPSFQKSNELGKRGAALIICLALLVILAASIAPGHVAVQQQADPASSSAPSASSGSSSGPSQDYLVYVVCESADKVVLLRFGPKGIQIERETRIGLLPMGDINGPHGIAVSPDKEYVYVSLATASRTAPHGN